MNYLVTASSPYLLQHAENPVDWYPWGPPALEKARMEDKPIFLSIGYAACHWCHVMAHESFADPTTAAYMNAHFVNIKVDREERPDLDSIYMQAVVALTGQGGWPLSVFLTPEGVPFYGGTYIPPVRRYNLPAFLEVLQAVAYTWENDRQELLTSGQQLLEHIRGQAAAPAVTHHDASLQSTLTQADQALAASYDWQDGGWGRAPRFPQPMAIEYLLQRATRGNRSALEMALHALQAMARGGMYDVVGGGFARYSTDDRWLVPHFEKMLYDNAQLASAYLHAWLLCRDGQKHRRDGRQERAGEVATAVDSDQHLRRVCERTLDFVLREMTHPQGGFYSSLDADSEGQEGTYYLWTPPEIRRALGDDRQAEFVIAAYQVTETGNFEGGNILQRQLSDEQLAEQFGLEPAAVSGHLNELHARLLAARGRRVRPATDDKILVSWNALMLAVFAEAGRYLDRPDYLAAAQRNARFLLDKMIPDGKLVRAWRESRPLPDHPPNAHFHMGDGEIPPGISPSDGFPMGEAGMNSKGPPAYLEDHAALILGLLALYQSDGDNVWYAAALHLADEMTAHFTDPAGGFFDTRADAETLIMRPKDLQDNATPSGSALAAAALLQLAAYEGRGDWRDRAEAMLAAMAALMVRYPTAFSRWLQATDFALGPVDEVAVVGAADHPLTQALLQVVWARYRPRLVAAASLGAVQTGGPALLHDRLLQNGLPTAYVCQGFSCQRPVNSAAELAAQLIDDL